VPEAVIVSAARSPIGRANKGSLTQLRPDDLAAAMVRAALDKVPALDPRDIDDLYLGCGLPGGEGGFNMARIVAVLLGYDHLPGATITRYCSSSVQTTRMAFHAIKAGEGDVFVSAGVETVSRYAKGNSDTWPDTKNPVFADAMTRTQETAQGGHDGASQHEWIHGTTSSRPERPSSVPHRERRGVRGPLHRTPLIYPRSARPATGAWTCVLLTHRTIRVCPQDGLNFGRSRLSFRSASAAGDVCGRGRSPE